MDENGQMELADMKVMKDKNMLRSHYNFTALDQKIILYAFAKYVKSKKRSLRDGIRIPCKDLKDYLEIDGNNMYAQMHEASTRLMSSFIDIKDEESQKFVMFNLIRYADYHSGALVIFFSDEAISYIETTDQISYLLKNFKMLQSRYSIRIYEILKSYLEDSTYPFDDKKRKYIELDLTEFRYMTGTTSKDSTGKTWQKYKNTGDFKIKVLDVADKEINSFTDMNIRYILLRSGRSFKYVGFWISSKNDDPSEVFTKEIHDVKDLKLPDIDVVETPSETETETFQKISDLMKSMPELKLLQVKKLIESSDTNTILFVYNYLTKDGNHENLYQRMMDELQQI